jgi:hypothetical protein
MVLGWKKANITHFVQSMQDSSLYAVRNSSTAREPSSGLFVFLEPREEMLPSGFSIT